MQSLSLLLTTVCYFPEAPMIKASPCSFMYSTFLMKKLGPCFSDKRARTVVTLSKQFNSLRTNDSEAQPAGGDSSGRGGIAPKPQGIQGQALREWAGFGRDRYPSAEPGSFVWSVPKSSRELFSNCWLQHHLRDNEKGRAEDQRAARKQAVTHMANSGEFMVKSSLPLGKGHTNTHTHTF